MEAESIKAHIGFSFYTGSTDVILPTQKDDSHAIWSTIGTEYLVLNSLYWIPVLKRQYSKVVIS